MLALKVPLPPSTNALYANVKGIGRVKTRAYRNFVRTAGLYINAQQPERFTGPVEIKISLPANNRADVDNRAKGILDVLVKCAVIKNDSPKYVKSLFITGTEAPPGPDCIVTITEWKEGA